MFNLPLVDVPKLSATTNIQDGLFASLRETLQAANLAANATVWVALSGGMDSTALAHCCRLWQTQHPKVRVALLHVDHALQAQSQAWARACTEFAAQLALEIHVLTVDLSRVSSNVEATARNARFAAMARQLHPQDVLLLAHHANDQAETMLMKLLRGDGARGLAGMRADAKLFGMRVLRPWLTHPRAELESYAKHQQLRWIHDPMNEDARFTRTQVRQNLIPAMQAIAPDAVQKMTQVAQQLQADRKVIRQQNQQELAQCLGLDHADLQLARLREFGPARRAEILRTWLHQMHVFDADLIRRAVQLAEAAAPIGQVSMPPNRTLYRAAEHLSLRANVTLDKTWGTLWQPDSVLTLPAGLGQLAFNPPVAAAAIGVRLRQGGERILLPGREHHHAVKKVLQACEVPAWQRKRLILLKLHKNSASPTESALGDVKSAINSNDRPSVAQNSLDPHVDCVVGVVQSARFVEWLAQYQTRLVHNQ